MVETAYEVVVFKALFTCVFLFFSFPSSVMAAPRDVMEVSWFGPGLQGNPLFDGRPFDMDDPSVAAHRSFPYGTKLRLLNPDNGRSILVVVQTRGPFVDGRDLDISREAAKRIGIFKVGVKHLVVERIR